MYEEKNYTRNIVVTHFFYRSVKHRSSAPNNIEIYCYSTKRSEANISRDKSVYVSFVTSRI